MQEKSVDTIKLVINTLISEKNIPERGPFEVTDYLLECYFFTYKRLTSTTSGTTTNSNTKYARRLAGLNLLKENIKRGVKASEIKAGHTYLISNPAFPLHYKIGVSYDVHKRLSQYQTYSPYRDFKLVKYDFVQDKFKIEQQLVNHPLLHRENGEWVLKDNAVEVFNDLGRFNINRY